jgi:hypothetical protein
MAKQTAPLIPLSAEEQEEIIQLVLTAEEPLTELQFIKRCAFSRKVSEKEVAGILSEGAASGRIHRWPPKTAKGKPRYWGQDADQAQREAVLRVTQNMEKPFTARELARQIKAPIKISEADVLLMLDELVQGGRLFVIPAATAKGKSRYWNRNAVEFGRLTWIELLRKKGPQPEASLKRTVKWLEKGQFQTLLNDMLAGNELCRHPVAGAVKRETYGLEPPRPGPYLEDWGSQLRKINSALLSAKVASEEIRRSVVQVVEAAGVSLGAGRETSHDATLQSPSHMDLIALMQRIEPGAGRGALVGTTDLRRASGFTKLDFDRAVLSLSRQGRLSLHRHDFASSLTAAEREELVTDGAGNYYVGVAIRQNVG